MKSLFDYEILLNDVFYRSEHVLSYIERRKELSKLDREAISNTILDALVSNGLIDIARESLDLDNLCIRESLEYTRYDSTPNVTSIPLEFKEKIRHKSVIISGSVPISVFYAKPAGNVTFCIYDMNTALSTIFDDFAFLDCNYDSPTREGVRATKRPFLEIMYNGEVYYIDALTKRMFKKSWFDETYNLEVLDYVKKNDFDRKQRRIYKDQTEPSIHYADYLLLMLDMMSVLGSLPSFEETVYEIDKSRELYPDSFKEVDYLKEDMMKKMFI